MPTNLYNPGCPCCGKYCQPHSYICKEYLQYIGSITDGINGTTPLKYNYLATDFADWTTIILPFTTNRTGAGVSQKVCDVTQECTGNQSITRYKLGIFKDSLIKDGGDRDGTVQLWKIAVVIPYYICDNPINPCSHKKPDPGVYYVNLPDFWIGPSITKDPYLAQGLWSGVLVELEATTVSCDPLVLKADFSQTIIGPTCPLGEVTATIPRWHEDGATYICDLPCPLKKGKDLTLSWTGDKVGSTKLKYMNDTFGGSWQTDCDGGIKGIFRGQGNNLQIRLYTDNSCVRLSPTISNQSPRLKFPYSFSCDPLLLTYDVIHYPSIPNADDLYAAGYRQFSVTY